MIKQIILAQSLKLKESGQWVGEICRGVSDDPLLLLMPCPTQKVRNVNLLCLCYVSNEKNKKFKIRFQSKSFSFEKKMN